MKVFIITIALLTAAAFAQTSQPTSQPVNINNEISNNSTTMEAPAGAADATATQPAVDEKEIPTPDNVRFFGVGGKGEDIKIVRENIVLKNINMDEVRAKITSAAKAELTQKKNELKSNQAEILKEIRELEYEKQQMQRPTKSERKAYIAKQKELSDKISDARKQRLSLQKKLTELQKLIPGTTYFTNLTGSNYGASGLLFEKYLKVIKVVDGETVLCERITAYSKIPDTRKKRPQKTPVLIKMNTADMKPQQMINADMPFIKIGSFDYKDGGYETSDAILQPVEMNSRVAVNSSTPNK